MTRLIFIILLITSLNVYAEPKLRPDTWGHSIVGTSLENFYKIDDAVYRSAQPGSEHMEDFQSLGITDILNLRYYHSDADDMKESDFTLHRVKMSAGNVTETHIIDALTIIKNRKGPILVHCWHGSDRTGTVIAAYRIIFNHWTKSQALDEMTNGGYGYHAWAYPNLVDLINNLDVNKIRQALFD